MSFLNKGGTGQQGGRFDPQVPLSRRLLDKKTRNNIQGYLLLVPVLVFVIGILGYGVVSAFITSLHDVDMMRPDEPFVGFANYIDLATDPGFQNSFIRSVIFVVASVVLGTIIAFVAALSIYRLTRMRNVTQAVALIPYMVSGISAAVAWRFMFTGDASLINMLLRMGGWDAISWLGHGQRALMVVILANTWKVAPFSVLIILAGLFSIDKELFDAAEIDGANGRQKFSLITVPLIAPMIAVSTIWLNFASFNMFDIILATTGGGPHRATDLMAVHLYKLAFERLDFSGASTVMIILLLINVSVSIVSLKRSKV